MNDMVFLILVLMTAVASVRWAVNEMKDLERWTITLATLISIIWLTLAATILWVVGHFVVKFW